MEQQVVQALAHCLQSKNIEMMMEQQGVHIGKYNTVKLAILKLLWHHKTSK